MQRRLRVLVIGGDGYLGWPTAMHFSQRGHEVAILDNGVKRRWEAELGVAPLNPIPNMEDRVQAWEATSGQRIVTFVGDVGDAPVIKKVLTDFAPDTIVHYGEQPSAPFSMIDATHAIETQSNNILGTLQLAFAIRECCPMAHLIKLGTMGEYGTPNIDIEEGFLDVTHNGRTARVLFPKDPGSFYHASKVHDSHNLFLASRVLGLRVTDLNQGVVYGVGTEETLLSPELATSFHYDSYFGTMLNRFITQAVVGIPLTVYGSGGQTRAVLNIRDTLQCVEIAALNAPPEGVFRVFNQFTESFSVLQLAERVVDASRVVGLRVSLQHLPNPRVEAEAHWYRPKNDSLRQLGLRPNLLSQETVVAMLSWAAQFKARIDATHILPVTRWRRDIAPEVADGVGDS